MIIISNYEASSDYVLGEFNFGFELEAIDLDEHTHQEIKSILDDLYQPTETKKNIDSVITVDGTVKTYGDGVPFEYGSKVAKFTPYNIKQLWSFLDVLRNGERFITNKTCGFHFNLTYPRISVSDLMWVIVHLATNQQYLETFLKLNDFEFTSPHSDPSFLRNVRDAVVVKDYSELRKLLTDAKSRTYRIHPERRLEWRGPRGVLNKQDVYSVKEFILLIVKYVKAVNYILSSKSIEGISKVDFIRNVVTSKLLRAQTFSPKQDNEVYTSLLGEYPWLKHASFRKALFVKTSEGKPHFVSGVWKSGVWKTGLFEGIWEGGTFMGGFFKDGMWERGTFKGGTFEEGEWYGGEWKKGTWKSGYRDEERMESPPSEW